MGQEDEDFREFLERYVEPVDSPAYNWFVRFKYMPMVSQLDTDVKCFWDHDMAIGQDEGRYMFDTALMKVSDVGAYMCALENVEDVRKFIQIRFLGQFVRHELLSQ